MVKILPINDCNDCPYVEKHEELIRCILSEAQSYEPEGNWIELLDQFCPLYEVKTIINDAYEMGKEHNDYIEKILKRIQKSNSREDSQKWDKTHKYMETIKTIKEDIG